MGYSVVYFRLLGTADLFLGRPTENLEHLGRLLGKKAIQECAIYFLSYARHETKSEQEVIAEWFSKPNLAIAKSVSARLDELFSNPDQRVGFLSTESLLNMFYWTLSVDIPEELPTGPEAEVNQFFLTLAFNDEQLRKYDLPAEFMDISNRPVQHGMLAMHFPQSDLINIDYAQLIYGQFYRAMSLLEFMEGNSDFHPLLRKLLETFGVSSKEEYIKAIGAAVLPIFKAKTPGATTFHLPDDEQEKSVAIFRQLAVPDLLSPVDEDFLGLRSNPFQEISQEEYRVVFDLFQVKMIYTGLYFKLLSFVRKDKSLFKKDYSGTFRSAFSEGVLVYQVLDTIFSKPGTVKITGNEFKPMPVEPDYYVRDGNTVFLFESKDFFIPGKIKASYDFLSIEAELKKRLHYDKNQQTGVEKNGAVRQIAVNVRRVLERSLAQDSAYNVGNLTIFPVVIVHDAVFSASGLNYLVNDWFNEEMVAIRADPQFAAFDFSRIMPVTVIEIDTLILLQEALKANPAAFEQLLRDYHTHVRLNYKGGFRSEEEAMQYAQTSVLPFAEFARTVVDQTAITLAIQALMKRFGDLGIRE